jgi:hypothetical protein
MTQEPFITVVAGVPRSGTSLMMQMLKAGGMPLLTDGVRAADDDNPRGYFEFEAVKRVREDASWLDQAVGKAVKIVHLLLRDLPDAHQYRVLFMNRNMAEVVRSQQRMLERAGRKPAAMGNDRLARVFERQLEQVQAWLERKPNMASLVLDYNELICDPRPPLEQIGRFLGCTLDLAAMAAVVDPALYRQRVRLEL